MEEGMKCPICQVSEIPDDPNVPCCLNCRMTGREMEFYLTSPVRSNVLTRIRELEHVESADLWPTAALGAAWMLAITLKDHKLVTPLAFMGDSFATPAIPVLGQPWIIVWTEPTEEDPTAWRAGNPDQVEGEFDDDGLVEAIESFA